MDKNEGTPPAKKQAKQAAKEAKLAEKNARGEKAQEGLEQPEKDSAHRGAGADIGAHHRGLRVCL